jgi:hypothetical protein
VIALVIALIAACATPGGGGARAQEQERDVFTVSQVVVDVTADTANQARTRALAEAHEAAFARLLSRLVPAGRRAEVPPVPGAQVERFVRDFEISGEKTSPVRYIASLSFRFRSGAVRQFLRRANIPFAETPSKLMVLLPVYRLAGAYLLWDDPNPWREAWHGASGGDGLVPIVIPAGDISDVNEITAEQAVRGRSDRLRSIASRYGSGDVILALAAPTVQLSTNVRLLQVTTTRFGSSGNERTTVRNFPATGEQTIEDLIAASARSTADQIQEEWKQENLLRPNAESEIIAHVPLSDLGDLVDIETRLGGIGMIRRASVVSLTRNEARLRLRIVGDQSQLAVALAQKDLRLATEDEKIVLKSSKVRTDAAPAGETGQ